MAKELFTTDQATQLESMIDAKVGKALSERDKEVETDSFGQPLNPLLKQDRDNLRKIDNVWRSGGYMDKGTKVTVDELCELDRKWTKKMRDNFSSDHPLLTQRVVVNVAQEAIEPALMLTPLLDRVNMPNAINVVFPSWGAMVAGKVGEGEEYPEQNLELGGRTSATIGKWGVACKFTDEMLMQSQFDVMSAHVRAAGRALARLKEQNVSNMITTSGTVLLDNTVSNVKSSTGRNAAGTYNGTLTLEDLFYVYSQMVNTGFTPNTLIMHPFAWPIFAQEGISRAFGFINGVNPLMWQAAQGRPGNAPQWQTEKLIGGGNTYVSQPQQLATTFTNVPSIFPTNFTIVVTPYMPFSSTLNSTTIALVDRNAMGVLVVGEDITTEEWDDPARDIRKIKFRERYAVASSNDGKGIGLMNGIKIARSFDLQDKMFVQLTGVSLTGDETMSGTVP